MTLRIGSILPDPARTARHAALSESAGFAFVGAGEHVSRDAFPGSGEEGRSSAAGRPGDTQIALTALAVAAGATSRVRLLTSVAIAPLHHPVMLAKEAAVLDAASGGRLTLGVGVGGEFPAEFHALGVPVSRRGSRTDEALGIMKSLWTGENVSHEGKHFSFRGLTLLPRPAQPAGPPLWVGGRSEAAMRRAARYGDGWLPYLYRPSHYSRSVEAVRELLEGAGRRLDGFGWGLHLMAAVCETYEESLAVATAGLRAGYVYGGDYERLAERYCLLGPPARAAEQLVRYHESGARDILLAWLAPAANVADQIALVGEKVLPAIEHLG